MNIDPLYMTIALLALFNAVRLKHNQFKTKRREAKMRERAAIVAARRRVEESRGKGIAGEREWMTNNDPKINTGKVWEY